MLCLNNTLTKQALTDNLNTVHTISMGELAVKSLYLPYAGEVEPSWYPAVSSALTTMQSQASSWETQTGPAIFSVVPQSVLDLGNFCVNTCSEMQAIVNQAKQSGATSLSSSQIADLSAICNEISQMCSQASTKLAGYDTHLCQVISDFTAARTELVKAVNEAEQVLEYDETQLQQIEAQISALQVKIARLSSDLNHEEVGTATAVFGIVVSAVTIAATGGLGSIISISVGLVQVAFNTIKEVINSKEVQQDIDAINTLMVEANDETFQMMAMRSLIQSIDTVLYQNMNYQDAFPTLEALLSTLSAEAQNISVALAQPSNEWSKIPNLLTLEAAQANWQELITFATQAQESLLTRSQEKISLSTSAI
ncbi:hypothetical protein CWB96_16595 [Pseudoalteromonas citrea]|uniref:Non-hemolytic enterotoxin lytic component L1 n=1 Tax=Pseudoalteromonas citrea TaxID=43655 RepID=A0A5S3XKR5_9GAMM|nr:hypothetical protein [Pseudoalteromonas citrea]TMP39928.1 hypothetical protein CWB97_20370 [Pseudoalteromonas citrea]TMP55726.1 hypothetical protein CWB96_16595 [Pseudoalteromonas citrea]